MTKSQFITATLLAGSAMLIATPATAQRVDRIVSFGDSYADTGIATRMILSSPLTPPATAAQIQTVYSTGRFSGGINYIDALGQIYQAPVVNYAIGGAMTNNSNVNFGLPGLTTEVQAFLANGISPYFPANGGFQSGDLVAISVGGNDARAYQQGGGTLAGAPTAATTAAAQATGNLNLLVGAGAPTISFLAGDTGLLPEIAANPTGAAIRTSFSTTFNSAMQTTLSGYAANGVMVHYLDLSKVLANVQANPSGYGMTSGIVCPTFPAPTCVTNSSGYLFYGDALHLTSDGFRVVGQYVATQLQAPLTFQAPSEKSMLVARQFGRTLSSRMDLSAPRDGDQAEGTRLFLVGDAATQKTEMGAGNDQFRASTAGATVGAQFGFGNGSVGIAANYSRPKVNFGNDAADGKGRSVQIGAFGGVAMGPAFVQGYLGYGWDKHELTRAGVVENMEANPKGKHSLAGAKAGYLAPMGGMRIGPIVALDYAKAKVNGYTESGDGALDLNVSSVSYKSLRGSIGLELRGDIDNSGIQFRPYAAALIEKDFSGDDRTVRFSQTSAPTIVNSWALDDVSKKAYGRFNAGFSAGISNSISIDASVNGTISRDQGDETGGQLAVSFGF